jgi:hypothetical protein
MNPTPETHATTEQVESKNGRQADGRFAPGNAGGPGNPYARKVAEYRKALFECVSIEELGRVVAAIKKKALEGDVAAAKLIFQYVLGKPITPVDPDRLDVDEWQKLLEAARPPREMGTVLNSVPANLASRLTNITWPCTLETNFLGPFQLGLEKLDERDAKRADAAAKKTRAAAAPKANGENGRSSTVAGVSDPGHSKAPNGNGDDGAPRAAGVVPMPNL